MLYEHNTKQGGHATFVSLVTAASLVFSFGCPALAFADRGPDVKPDNIVFKTYPKSQTSYKSNGTKSVTVKSLYKSGNKILAAADTVSGTSTLMGGLGLIYNPIGVVGTIAGVSSYIVTTKVKNQQKRLSKFNKKNFMYKLKTQWKWVSTKSQPYIMKVKYTEWFTYKNKK